MILSTINTIYYQNPYTNPDVTSAGQVWWVALTRDTSGYGFCHLVTNFLAPIIQFVRLF